MPVNLRQYPIGALPGDIVDDLDLTLDELRNSRLRLTSPLQPPEDYEARSRVIPTATLRQILAQRHLRIGAAVGVAVDGRASMVNEAINGYLGLLAPSPPKPQPTVRGGEPRERMRRAFDRPRTPLVEPQVPELERRLREPGAAPAPLGPGEVAGGVSLRGVIPQGVRDIAGGAVQTFLKDIARPGGAIGGFLAGEDPLESIVGFAQGWMEPGGVNWENVAGVHLLPEGSEARRIAAEVARVAFDPLTWGMVAVTGPGAVARLGLNANPIIKNLLIPLIPGGTRARFAVETAFGATMVLGTEEAIERGANPVVALGVGMLTAVGTLAVVRSLARAAPSAARVAAGIGEAALDPGPLLRGEAVPRAQLLPFGPDIIGLEQISTAARADARSKAVEAVRAEASLRQAGVVARELKVGRPVQAAEVSGAFEQARAAGITGEELAARARAGAAGRIRQTFAPALDVTPEQAGALIDDISERFLRGEMNQFEYLNETVAMQRLLRGEGLEPEQIKLLAGTLGVEDIRKLSDAQLTPRTEAKFIKDTLALNKREQDAIRRTTERAERDAHRIVERARKEQKALGEEFERKGAKTVAARIKTWNKADANEIAVTRRYVARIEEKALRQTAADRRALIAQQNARERLLERAPNEEMLRQKAMELLAELDPEIAQELGETLVLWQRGNRAIFDAIGPEGAQIIASTRAAVTGDVADSYITSLLTRRAILADQLRGIGIEGNALTRVLDALTEAELLQRYGPTVPERVRELIAGTKRFTYDETPGALETFAQRAKNTTFGLLDVGVFGQQILRQFERGGVADLVGFANRLLAGLNLSHIPTMFDDVLLSKQAQYALDGVGQGIHPSPVRATEGSLAQYLGPIGRVVDKPYIAATDWLTRMQFGHVLTWVRNLNHEGNLVMLHAAGQDIMNPTVRAQAAEFSNAASSFARNALKKKRASKEKVALISPSMTRAQINLVNQVAKGLNGNATQRVLAATTILTTAASWVAIGKFLHDMIGVGEFEFDPSKPGSKLITLRNGIVINLFPQASYETAIVRSVRALVEAEPVEAAKAWARFALGRESIVGRIVGSVVGFGFAPGRGFKFGDLTAQERLLNVAPIPPVIAGLILEGTDVTRTAFEALGVSAFPESAFSLAERTLREQGLDPEKLTAAERRQALAGVGLGAEIEEKRVTELRELAGRGDRTAQALLISVELRTELARIADDVRLPDGSVDRAEYRRRRGGQTKIALGERLAFADVFESFKESDNPIEQLSGRWFDLIQEATTGREVDWELFEEIETQWAATLEPGQFDAVMANVNAVDPRDNPLEQELQQLRTILEGTGFFDMRKQAWSEFSEGSPETQRLTEKEWRDKDFALWADSLRRGGTPEELIPRQVRDIIAGTDVIRGFNDFYASEFRFPWVTSNPGLAGRADLWGYFTRPDLRDSESSFIEAVLRAEPGVVEQEIEAAQAPEPEPEARRRGRPLDETTAEMIRLRGEGLSQGQIAIQLGLTTNAVKLRLKRARERGELAA